MKLIQVVGEDRLTCSLGEQLVVQILDSWELAENSINTGGVTKLQKALPRYMEQAKNYRPVLCIADTDNQCAVTLIKKWLPLESVNSFMLRLAEPEAESWLLADRDALAEFMKIPTQKIPAKPDQEKDPKEIIIQLAKRSKKREIRQEMVGTFDSKRPGSGYNFHLCQFVRECWDAKRASINSPSLGRALTRLKIFNQSSVL